MIVIEIREEYIAYAIAAVIFSLLMWHPKYETSNEVLAFGETILAIMIYYISVFFVFAMAFGLIKYSDELFVPLLALPVLWLCTISSMLLRGEREYAIREFRKATWKPRRMKFVNHWEYRMLNSIIFFCFSVLFVGVEILFFIGENSPLYSTLNFFLYIGIFIKKLFIMINKVYKLFTNIKNFFRSFNNKIKSFFFSYKKIRIYIKRFAESSVSSHIVVKHKMLSRFTPFPYYYIFRINNKDKVIEYTHSNQWKLEPKPYSSLHYDQLYIWNPSFCTMHHVGEIDSGKYFFYKPTESALSSFFNSFRYYIQMKGVPSRVLVTDSIYAKTFLNIKYKLKTHSTLDASYTIFNNKFFGINDFFIKIALYSDINKEYSIFFLFFVSAFILSFFVGGIGRFVGNSTVVFDRSKISIYECGFQPFEQLDKSQLFVFYRLAVFFIIFESELIFLFPWLINIITFIFFNDYFFFYSPTIFIAILIYGFFYEMRNRALDLL